jgi:hypothetical protein
MSSIMNRIYAINALKSQQNISRNSLSFYQDVCIDFRQILSKISAMNALISQQNICNECPQYKTEYLQ